MPNLFQPPCLHDCTVHTCTVLMQPESNNTKTPFCLPADCRQQNSLGPVQARLHFASAPAPEMGTPLGYPLCPNGAGIGVPGRHQCLPHAATFTGMVESTSFATSWRPTRYAMLTSCTRMYAEAFVQRNQCPKLTTPADLQCCSKSLSRGA